MRTFVGAISSSCRTTSAGTRFVYLVCLLERSAFYPSAQNTDRFRIRRLLAGRIHRTGVGGDAAQGSFACLCPRGALLGLNVRSFAIQIGLLPRDNPEQIPFAYKLYESTDANNVALAAGFKQTFCRDVQIEFLGVWCVEALRSMSRTKTDLKTQGNGR